MTRGDSPSRLLATAGEGMRIPLHLQDAFQQIANRLIVVDDKNSGLQHHLLGIHRVKTDPLPTSLSTNTSPPCLTATSFTNARPSPNPLWSRVSLLERR